MLACYECLLSYATQNAHGMINRHLVRDWLLQLAAATPGPAREPAPGSSLPEPGNPQAAAFLEWLRSRGHRLPDEIDTEVYGARPDFVYRLPDGNAAIFVSGSKDAKGGDNQRNGNEWTQDDLRDLGWSVITVGDEETWAAVTARYPSIFGPP